MWRKTDPPKDTDIMLLVRDGKRGNWVCCGQYARTFDKEAGKLRYAYHELKCIEDRRDPELVELKKKVLGWQPV